MTTGCKVIWSDKATHDVQRIISYLEDKWGTNVADAFLTLLFERINLISKHPQISPLVDGTEYTRYTVLSAQITIYYEFQDEIVEILMLFDTRQSPDKKDL